MKNKALSIAAFLVCAAPVFGQAPKLVQKVTTNGSGKLVIPYEKYVLPNGLQIVVHEDHSDPVVYVDVTYHVGSAREQQGRSGFAHFFEHMMFQGSEHVADEEHFKRVNEAGGTLNGSTNLDRTNYFETLPANNLELALWLEADRMGFLLDSVTQRKFEVQRATVKNERGQRYDNAPYGLVFEKISEAIYPPGHPYSWSTIGYLEDLNRVDVTDLKNFFMRWYGPNNATLTVAGDVKTADVIKLAEKYFGPIPRGPEVKNKAAMPAVLDGNRYTSYEDNVRFPQLVVNWPTVPARTPDEPALDALADILSDGKSSIFYKNFVENRMAQFANMGNGTAELSGTMRVTVRAFPGKNLAQMDSIMQSCFAQFESRGVTDDDVKRFKLKVEQLFLDQMESVQSKGSLLASYNTFMGDPNYLKKEMETYQKITKEDVMRVYNKYIKGKPAVYLSVYPKGKSNLKLRDDNFKMYERMIEQESPEYKNLSYKKPVDKFDRSKRPAGGPTPVVKAPQVWKQRFANGLQVIGTRSDEMPRVSLMLSISAGHRQEEISKSGLAQMTARMLDQSTLKRTAGDMEHELEMLGSSIAINTSGEEVIVNVNALSRNLDAVLKLLEEKLFQPKFDQSEFDMVKKQQLEGIANRSTQAGTMADLVFNKSIYGDQHINSMPVNGTMETVGKLALDDVKKYYKTMYSPNIANLVIVGDKNKEEILPKLKFLETWASTNVKLKPEDPIPAAGKTKIFLFNKEKAAQSEIRIARTTGLTYDATGEYYRAQVMNFVLGGNFNSRINMNLRENKGWTYGSNNQFTATQYSGHVVATAGVKWEASDSAVVEFIKEIRNYHDNGITPAELEYTKQSLIQREALAYESPDQKLLFLKRMQTYNLPEDFTVKQNEILRGITKEEIDALAKKHLQVDKLSITVVGDKEKIGSSLAKLGYEVVEVDAEGKAIPVVVKEEPKKETPPPVLPKEEPKKGKKKNKRPKGAKYGEITK
ncbi:MAG: zinc protease [Bacteroidetes bacterium]|nr:MAG: zinc protease [Bacteroidota bacterium]